MSTQTHCAYCGRALVESVERDKLYDRATGNRGETAWMNCPRFPRNGWQAMYRGVHESFKRDNPIYGRTWS